MTLRLDPERARTSAVHGSVALVSRGEGADALVSRLVERGGVACRPTGTRILQQGIARVLDNHLSGAGGGISALAGEQQVLEACRHLADAPLAALAEQTGVRCVIDRYIDPLVLDLAAGLYPDAVVIGPQRLRAFGAAPTTVVDEIAAELGLGGPNERPRSTSQSGRDPQPLPPAVGPVDPSVGSPFRGRALFVLSAPRSGSTWLTGLLLTHPAVVGLAEAETWVFQALRDLWTNDDLRAWIDDRRLAHAVRRFVDALFVAQRDASRSEATWFVEKSPAHVFRIPEMASAYPDARYLHLVRDGRDVARSMREADVGEGGSLVECARYWVESVRAVQRQEASLERVREVRYERLVEDPVGGFDEICAWAGLPTDETVKEAVSARSAVQVSRHGTTGPPGPGKWRSLSRADRRAVRREAGGLLGELGYLDAGHPRRALGLLRRTSA